MMIKRVWYHRCATFKCLSQPKYYRIFTVSMALACGGGRHKGRRRKARSKRHFLSFETTSKVASCVFRGVSECQRNNTYPDIHGVRLD
eukprot:scaffold3612_cov124-Skeletonema_menzelii.AAC.3